MTKLDQELEQFRADLLASVKELKSGEIARKNQVEISYVNPERNHEGLSLSSTN
jgi:hypothetical protein